MYPNLLQDEKEYPISFPITDSRDSYGIEALEQIRINLTWLANF